MKHILIIENEFQSIKETIDSLMMIMDDQLCYNLVPASQDIDWNKIGDYDAIFVDISLTYRSHLDGYGILKKISSEYSDVSGRVAIITGNHVIEQELETRQLNNKGFTIFQKPLKFMALYNFLQKLSND